MKKWQDLRPATRQRVLKICTYFMIPTAVGAYKFFIHDDLVKSMSTEKISLKDRMSAAQALEDETPIRSEGLLASRSVQALWADLDTVRTPVTKETQPAASSTPRVTETPIPTIAPVVENETKEKTTPLPSPKIEPVQKTEEEEERTVKAILVAQNEPESQPKRDEIGDASLHRSAEKFNRMVGKKSNPPEKKADNQDPVSEAKPSLDPKIRQYFGWQGTGTTLSASGPVAGSNQLKHGTTILAVLKHDVVVGSDEVQTVFYTLGPTNNVSNVPTGITMIGTARLSVDRRRAMIKIHTCANDDKEAAALPCQSVVRDYKGAEGLPGEFYNPKGWAALYDGISAYMSTLTLSKLTTSVSSMGQVQLEPTQANEVRQAIAASFTRAGETLKDSLPSTELRISGGTIVEIMVTESVRLW